LIRSPQSIEVLRPRLTIWRSGLHMRKAELIEQRGKEDTSNPTIKILEGMNPLKPSVGPDQLYLSFDFALYVS
jgi:hypothetical protein